MSIAITAIGVVVPIARLEERWPGGCEGYRRSAPNATYRTDGYLAAIDFMTPADAARWEERLSRHGLIYVQDGAAQDIAVVDARQGPCARCAWLTWRAARGWSEVALIGAPPSPLTGPPGWSPDDASDLHYVDGSDAARDYAFAGFDGRIAEFNDERTGETRYAGVTSIEALADELSARLDVLNDRVEALRPVSESEGPEALDAIQRATLLAVADEAEQMAKLVPPLAPGGHFVAGLAARVSGDYERALQAWEAFASLVPEHTGAWMELTWCLTELGRLDEALGKARRGVELEPDHAGAHANLAMSLVRVGHLDEAEESLLRSLELAPDDPVTLNVQRMLRDARALQQ